MKDVVAFLKFLVEQNSGWWALAAVILAAPVMYKLIKESISISHAIKGKKLEGYISRLEKTEPGQSKILVEQNFADFYGRMLGYNEIGYLYSFSSPSLAIKNYFWGNNYLNFDEDNVKYRYKHKYWLKVREISFNVMFVIAMLFSMFSLLFFTASLISGSEMIIVFNSGLILAMSVFFFWFSVNESRALSAANYILRSQPERVVLDEFFSSSEKNTNTELENA